MRRLLSIFVLGAAFLGGCQPSSTPAPAQPPAAASSQPAQSSLDRVAEAVEAQRKAEGEAKGETVGPERYEQLLLALEGCELNESGIKRDCEALQTLRKARKGKRTAQADWTGGLAALGRKHATHASPAVRIQAATLMGSVFGTSVESQKALLAATQAEADARVLRHQLRTLASAIGKNAEVAALMLKKSTHADAQIRMEAVSALSSGWAKGTEGTLERVLQMAQEEPDAELRRYACRRLGERGDERVLPLLEALTAEVGEDPQLYAACFRGLVSLWSNPIAHEKPSQRAYELTLERLAQRPRSEQQPPWGALPAMVWVKSEKFQAAAPWFRVESLIEAIADVVADLDAGWLARSSGVDTLIRLEAPPAVYEPLKTLYAQFEGKQGVEMRIYEKIVQALQQTP